MKKILFTLFIAILFISCYNDKGNYNYHDINEVTIAGIGTTYKVTTGVTRLVIDPMITATMDTANLEYEWRASIAYQQSWVIGTSRILSYDVDLEPRTYDLYLRIKDKLTGVVTENKSSLVVGTATSRGIMVLGENQSGEVQLDMLAMATDTIHLKDLLKDKGFPTMKNPEEILHTGYYSNTKDKRIKIWLMTDDGAYSLDRTTFKNLNVNFESSLFMTNKFNTKFIPIDVLPHIYDINGNAASGSSNRAVVCSNGYLFNSSLVLMGGDYYQDPVNRTQAEPDVWLKCNRYVTYSLKAWNGLVWYDEINNRFMKVGAYEFYSSLMTDVDTDPFPWNQSGVGRTMVYAENTLDTEGGAKNGNSFVLMTNKTDGSYYIYKFYVTGNPLKRNCYTVKSIATDFGKASFYAFSSSRTVVYYAVGSKLYAYDYNIGNEKSFLLKDFGDPITMLKCDTQMDSSTNPLYIATYNSSTGGTLQKYNQGTNPDEVTIVEVPAAHWTGFPKIKKISWRAAN
jgi:hypothetical protein